LVLIGRVMGTTPEYSEFQEPSFTGKTQEEASTLLQNIEALGKIGHWEVDLITEKSFWSDQILKILDVDPKIATPSIDFLLAVIHPEDREAVLQAFRKSIKMDETFKIEIRIVRPDGEIRHLISEGTVYRDSEGSPVRLLGISKDITEEKLKEAQLQKSYLQIENILKTTQDLIFLTDEVGTFLQVSQSCEKILGYTIEELIGKSFRDLIHPDDLQKTIENRKSIMEGTSSSDFQNRYFKKDGSIIDLNWSATLDTNTHTVFAVARDITQLVHTREALKSDSQKMSIVLNASPEAIWAVDRDYNLVTANNKFLEAVKKNSGWNIKPGDSMLYNTPFPQEFVQEWKLLYDRAFRGETFTHFRKSSLIVTDGYLEVTVKTVYDSGNLIALVCYAKDITERMVKELEMQELVDRINQAHKIGKMGYWEVDLNSKKLFWSAEIYNIWEVDPREFQPDYDHFHKTIHPEDFEEFLSNRQDSWSDTSPLDIVHRIILPSGKIKFVHQKGGMEIDPISGIRRYRGTVQDVTEEKLIEKELRDRNEFIESTLRNIPLGVVVTKISTGEPTYINPSFTKICGWGEEYFTNIEAYYEKVFPDPEARRAIYNQYEADIKSGIPERMEWQNVTITTQTGEERIINGKNILIPEQDLMISTVTDDTDRYWAEHALRTSNERFHLATQAVSDAIWDWDVPNNRYFYGEGFSKLFGIDLSKEADTIGIWDKRIHPQDYPNVRDILNLILDKKHEEFFEFEYRLQREDHSYAHVVNKVFVIRDADGRPLRVVGAIRDITPHKLFEESLKTLNDELANSNRELEISNKELEQFAYVASHDLQEPLRMISSFLGLIKKKYSPKLDPKGLQYIHYAVDGAQRMREIILDLLEFSKVGNHQEANELTSVQSLVEEVLTLNDKLIQEKNAVIHVGSLPTVFCHGNSIIQLIQNLLTNGLKYQTEGVRPEIWIDSKELEKEWLFSMRDNGIGIDPKFYDKIFIIFQRLHQKDQYSGTGIGLAICKKNCRVSRRQDLGRIGVRTRKYFLLYPSQIISDGHEKDQGAVLVACIFQP
jgi:PAS domain S-box-containing protein